MKKTLAEKLKNARIRKGLTMHQVFKLTENLGRKERRMCVTQGYISRLESGKETNPSYLKIIALSTVYGIRPGSLFDAPIKK